MKTLAIIILVLSALNVLLVPLFFGKSRGVYGYKNFTAYLLEFCMLLPICLYVINNYH